MSDLKYTRRQSEYLAFISQYEALMGVSPSEGDLSAFFGVAGSSAHQMVVTLEKKGALRRIGGVARSMEVLVNTADLPVLGWARSKLRKKEETSPGDSIAALLEFSDFLAQRICSRHAMTLAKVGSVSRIADSATLELKNLGASEKLIELTREYLLAMPWGSKKRTARVNQKLLSAKSSDRESSREASGSQQRRRPQGNPKQGTLFEDHQ